MSNSGKWALVTGASSGLGKEFARALAGRKCHVVLVARREEPMQALAAELRQQHGIEVVVETIDLSAAASSVDLQRRLDARGIEPDILINNAAFGLSGEFVTQDLERLREMLHLDILTLTELTHVYGKRMADRGKGHILLVSSLAAYQPDPLLAAYGAAKHYVLALGVALHVELAPKVTVTVVSPGLMDTGFNEVSGFRPKASMQAAVVSPAKVAEAGLKAMFAGKSSIVVGKINRFVAFTNRFTSRFLQAKLTYRLSK